MRLKNPRLISSGMIVVGSGIALLFHHSLVRLVGLAIALIGAVLFFRYGPYYD